MDVTDYYSNLEVHKFAPTTSSTLGTTLVLFMFQCITKGTIGLSL